MWEQAYSTAPETRPSVTSLMTGLFPSEHGVFQGIKRHSDRSQVTGDVLNPSHAALAETLSAHGWSCAAIINNCQLGSFTGLDRGFDYYNPDAGKADDILKTYEQWIKEHSDKPTFAYLHLIEAHWPYRPRQRFMREFGGDLETNAFREWSARDFGRFRKDMYRGGQKLTCEQIEDLMVMYDAAIRRLDQTLTDLAAIHESSGCADRTAVVVTADHGEEFQEHGSIGHGHALFEELIHVPLIIAAPDSAKGARHGEPVSLADLPKTLLGLAGVEADFPGVNLRDRSISPRPVLSEFRHRKRYGQVLRLGRWKLHKNYLLKTDETDSLRSFEIVESVKSKEGGLFDILSDPKESIDLASEAVHAPTRKWMEKQVRSLMSEIAGRVEQFEVREIEMDDMLIDRLRGLGYVD